MPDFENPTGEEQVSSAEMPATDLAAEFFEGYSDLDELSRQSMGRFLEGVNALLEKGFDLEPHRVLVHRVMRAARTRGWIEVPDRKGWDLSPNFKMLDTAKMPFQVPSLLADFLNS